jgi:hypothetical protein
MQDGAELGQAIVAHPDDVEAAFGQYEQIMFTRAAAEAGDDIYKVMFGDDAPQSMVAMLTRAEQAS